MTITRSQIFASIPVGLRKPLLQTYQEIVSNFAEHRWEPSELNGGKFCEVVYTVSHGALSGAYATKPAMPSKSNMRDACLALEKMPSAGKVGERSLRILIPRMLLPLYEVRNNRGVGHIGGDVNPNIMDAALVYSVASWIVAELVRIFHQVTIAEAQETVDALSERKMPLVWSPGGVLKRVLATDLNVSDQTLLLLQQQAGWVDDRDLFESIEYSNHSLYRSRILMKLHKERLIEFDATLQRVCISPKGSIYVDQEIIAPRVGV